MSDLYDSLEDDNDDKKAATFSLDLRKTISSDPVERGSEGKSTEKYSFYLNRNVNGERRNLCSVFEPFSDEFPERTLIFPKITNNSTEPDPETSQNVTVDSTALLEQGLQCNNDGGFTKSPRPEEELPFITREYRNLQFQKKKTYMLNKSTHVKGRKKNTSFLENVADNQVATNQMTNTQSQKGFSEGEVVSCSSLLSRPSQIKTKKKSLSVSHSKHTPNLTDSMKEKLFLPFDKDQNNDSAEESPRKSENKSPAASKSWQQNRTSAVCRRKTNVGKSQNLSPKGKPQAQELVSVKKKSKSVLQKIPKYKSDIMLNAPKSKLNYWERHQLESGFNPFCLRQERKRIPDDTDRSNFGDSVMEYLSEDSNRVLSCDNLGREEEEMFYRDLMQKDKIMKKGQRSSRSEGPLDFTQKELNANKDRKEALSGRSNSKCKRNSKALFIDMPCEGKQSVNFTKKSSHYCTSTSSSNLSKVELALKARTYGYLVNARNIFRMKAQSEVKYGLTEGGNNEEILNKTAGPFKDFPETRHVKGKLIKQNSLPVSMFPNVRTEILRKIQNLPRESASWSREKQVEAFKGSQRGVILPRVNDGQSRVGQMNGRLFQEIDSCLVSPNI